MPINIRRISMSAKIHGLEVLVEPCNNGMCPALYRDAQGRVFVRGETLSEVAQTQVARDEEIVEITPEILDFLRSYQR
jgi:hypothetical protein